MVQKSIGTGLLRIAPRSDANLPDSCALVNEYRTVDTRINSRGGAWTLPAQDYTVALISNNPSEIGGEDVVAYFRGENSVLPPTEQEGVTRAIIFTNSTQEERVSFQFRVVPTITLKSATPLLREDCLDSAELLVVDKDAELKIVLTVSEIYLDPSDPSHNVTGSVVVVESVTADGSGAGETFMLLKSLGSTVVEATATLAMTTGPPELPAPHLKRIRVQYGQMRPSTEQDWLAIGRRTGKGRLKLDVLINGIIALQIGKTFAIPEYVPFLILRDPPGDASSASFSSSHTASLSMSMAKDSADGFAQTLSVGFFPVEKDVVKCLGLGLAVCDELAHTSNGITVNQAHTAKGSRKDSKRMEFSVGFSNTISTSGEAGLTGAGGDMFFSPAVTVLIIENAKIYVPDTICEGRRIDFESWQMVGSQDDPEDKLSLSKSGSKVDDVALTNDIGAVEHGKSSQYNSVAAQMRADVKTSLDDVFAVENAWNTHSLHSMFDILKVRIPVLEESKVRLPNI